MYELIDCHCHLDFDAFDKDRDQVVERANENGINQIIIPGVKRDDWVRIRNICDENGQLHACYGLHPYLAEEHRDNDIPQLRDWLHDNACVAVGECGLDYRKAQADRRTQWVYFDAQLDIAQIGRASCRERV